MYTNTIKKNDNPYNFHVSLESLEQMMDFRNILTHEINNIIIGQPLSRWTLTLSEARDFLLNSFNIIKIVENEISKCTENKFPNPLDLDLNPISYNKILCEEINRYEEQIINIYSMIDNDNEFHSDKNEIIELIEFSRRYIEKEDNFISSARILRNRYIDIRGKARSILLESRARYIKFLMNEISVLSSNDPPPPKR